MVVQFADDKVALSETGRFLEFPNSLGTDNAYTTNVRAVTLKPQ